MIEFYKRIMIFNRIRKEKVFSKKICLKNKNIICVNLVKFWKFFFSYREIVYV